ncbi:MAG: hypothetical protein SGI77_20755 [Pirellulaceae bacterium]|nr:hypothetical protein [Pirellulaceae bacterium]
MLRAVLRKKTRDAHSGYETDCLYTIDFSESRIESELSRGGCGESGYEVVELVGVELIAKPDAVIELMDAAKDIRDNPGADCHGSVGFCAIELPKLARLRDAIAVLDSSR